MASYVPQFSDRLIGLTGRPEEIRAAAKAYRVYYEKVEDDSTSGGYTMDHTSIVYLMGPDGEYVDHFSTGTSPEAMAKGIAKHLENRG
jgi:protein SCO1/2